MRFHTNLAICVLVYIFISIWSCLMSFSFIPYFCYNAFVKTCIINQNMNNFGEPSINSEMSVFSAVFE